MPRRLLPFGLVGLVVCAVGLGLGLGLSEAPSRQPTAPIIGPSRGPTSSLVSVPRKSIGVTANWAQVIPPRRSTIASAGRTIARRLALDIDNAPVVTGSSYFCPLDHGIDVRLLFAYDEASQVSVNVNLTGCAWITSGRRAEVTSPAGVARWVTRRLRGDLLALSPPAWANRWLTDY